MDETSLTFSTSQLGVVFRGDYIRFGQFRGEHRITSISVTTATVRRAHRFRVVEWLRAKWEDWIAWPLSDLHRRFRTRE